MKIIRLLLFLSVLIICLPQIVEAVPAPYPDDFEIRHYFKIANIEDFDDYVFFEHVPYCATDTSGDWFAYSSDFDIIVDNDSAHSIPDMVDFVEVYALEKSHLDFNELMSLNTRDNKDMINAFFYMNEDKWIKANMDLVYPGDLGRARDYNGVTDVYVIDDFSENEFELIKLETIKNHVDRTEEDDLTNQGDNVKSQNIVWFVLAGIIVIGVVVGSRIKK